MLGNQLGAKCILASKRQGVPWDGKGYRMVNNELELKPIAVGIHDAAKLIGLSKRMKTLIFVIPTANRQVVGSTPTFGSTIPGSGPET
jgi:hypothetical protein